MKSEFQQGTDGAKEERGREGTFSHITLRMFPEGKSAGDSASRLLILSSNIASSK